MTLEQIKLDIREMLKEVTDFDVETVKDEDLLFDDLGLTSVGIVQIFVSCQEKYDISMHDEINMHAPVSINYISEIVLNKIKEAEKGKQEVYNEN